MTIGNPGNINRVPVSPAPVNTTPTAPVATVGPVAPVATGTTTVTPAVAPVPTGVTGGIPKMAVNGIADVIAAGKTVPGNQPPPGSTVRGGLSTWGGNRAYIQTQVTPTVGGWDFKVDLHSTWVPNDASVFVSARVTDGSKEYWVVLGMPFNGQAAPVSTDAVGMGIAPVQFNLSLDDINKFLLQKAGLKADGKTPKLQFRPGDPLSVDCKWANNHEAGGRRDETQGFIKMPPVLGRQSPVAVRTGAVAVGAPVVATGSGASKPVDLTVKVPDALVTQYATVLAPNAKMGSHREEEVKMEPKTFDELKGFTTTLISIAQLPKEKQAAELKKIFGEGGWTLEMADRYYQKDAAGKYVTYAPGEMVWKVKDDSGEHDFDFAGLPKVAGMFDQYEDSTTFEVAKANGAVRFRDGEFKGGEKLATMGMFNLKPGGGVVDPTSLVATRIEYSLDTLPGIAKDPAALAQMAAFLSSAPEPYNPMREFQKVNYNVNATAVQNHVLDNLAQRYKFNLHSESGMEVEISNDFVDITSQSAQIQPTSTKGMNAAQKYDYWQKQFVAQGLPFNTTAGAANPGKFVEYANNGKDRVEVNVELSVDAAGVKTCKEALQIKGRQIEIEMDHAQLVSPAGTQGIAPATMSGGTPSSAAMEDTVFKGISDSAEMGGTAQIHNVADLAEPALYQDSSYREMHDAVNKLRTWAFPGGINPTRQKSAMGLEKMGQIPPNAAPTLACTLLAQTGDSISASAYGGVFNISGTLASGKPHELVVSMNAFPFVFQLKGTETAKEIADQVAARLNDCVLWKPEVKESTPGQFQVTVVPR